MHLVFYFGLVFFEIGVISFVHFGVGFDKLFPLVFSRCLTMNTCQWHTLSHPRIRIQTGIYLNFISRSCLILLKPNLVLQHLATLLLDSVIMSAASYDAAVVRTFVFLGRFRKKTELVWLCYVSWSHKSYM